MVLEPPETNGQLGSKWGFSMQDTKFGEFGKPFEIGCVLFSHFLLPQTGELHICTGSPCRIGSVFIWLPGNGASFGGIIRRSTEERETVLLDQPAGQITAAGAADCKTLMDVRRL